MKNNRAFTLIEILVVVGVLGLITSIAAIVVTGHVHNARVKQAQTELEMIANAVDQLVWDTGRAPNHALITAIGSTEVWDLSTQSAGLLREHSAFPNWNGPYYEDALIDPWGKPYFYDPDYMIDGNMRPVVGSFGPNKVGPNKYDSDDVYVVLD